MARETWHAIPESEVFKILNSSKNGLSSETASDRFREFGPNEFKKEKGVSAIQIFVNQFKSFLILVLIAAVIISFILGEVVDASVILGIVILNALLGFVQEYRANKAMEALVKITAPHAIALRDGKQAEILARELVPGDVIILDEGRKVTADARLFEVQELGVDESELTGESSPVSKDDKVLKQELPIAEMKNMVFMGTNITRGYAKAMVVETGGNTEIGKIAKEVQTLEETESPLHGRLEKLGKDLTISILIIAAIIFFIGLYQHTTSMVELFLISVSLAVAAIPEALPAVVTLTLALGTQTMAKNKALVRRLLAVETLGTTSVICSDKTGTLTRNEMTVTKCFVDNNEISVTGSGYAPEGDFYCDSKQIDPTKDESLKLLATIGMLCNNSHVEKSDGEWSVIGDPTEGALTVLGHKSRLHIDILERKNFVSSVPFSSERKAMSSIYKEKGEFISYVKGAPEKMIEDSNYIHENGQIKKLDTAKRKELEKVAHEMASEPLRVLGFAYKKVPVPGADKQYTLEIAEKDLIFVGFVGMIDPPRIEVKDAIRIAHEAGIRTVMITGDHKITAIAIAKQIGIMREDDIALTGLEIDSLDENELENVIEKATVFARVSPDNKVEILEAFQKKGNVVAMTGDGVNDAPAIKRADIGIAMGIKGTDVAKEASDMILEDDNYSTIIKAVKSGREIYDNIRKFIKFMISMNFSELLLVSITAMAGFPLPLIPLQILWLNLVTDSLPSLALAVDSPDPDVMKRKPRKRSESIFSGGLLHFSITAAAIATGAVMYVFLWSLNFGIDYARTMVFTLMVMYEIIFVFNCRSESKSVFMINPFSNIKLVGTTALVIGLQVMIVQLPFFEPLFHTVPLDLASWGIVILFSLIGLVVSPLFFKKPEKAAT